MASFTLSTDRFPNGTTVTVYPLSNWPGHQIPPSGDPVGSSTTSGSVTGGSVTFTGLDDDTRYLAHGEVGGVDRYVNFSTYSLRPASQLPVVQVTQAEYDALTPDPQVMYVVSG